MSQGRGLYLDICHKRAPGWAEVEYFNDFEDETLAKRELLIGCAFAFTAGTTRLPWSLPAEAASASARPSRTWERTALRRVKAGFARFPLAGLGALGRRAVKR